MSADPISRTEAPPRAPLVEHPSWELALTDQHDVAAVRRAARELLVASVPEELLDDVVVVVSELVSNTYSHSQDPRLLRLSRSPGGVRVEVAGMVPSPALTEGSRAALVLDRLCAGWCVLAEPNGPSRAWALVPDDVR
ncbi:MAG: ATP-binding protein [Umezawaea sp.]